MKSSLTKQQRLNRSNLEISSKGEKKIVFVKMHLMSNYVDIIDRFSLHLYLNLSIQNTIDYLGQMTRLFTPSFSRMVIEEHRSSGGEKSTEECRSFSEGFPFFS